MTGVLSVQVSMALSEDIMRLCILDALRAVLNGESSTVSENAYGKIWVHARTKMPIVNEFATGSLILVEDARPEFALLQHACSMLCCGNLSLPL